MASTSWGALPPPRGWPCGRAPVLRGCVVDKDRERGLGGADLTNSQAHATPGCTEHHRSLHCLPTTLRQVRACSSHAPPRSNPRAIRVFRHSILQDEAAESARRLAEDPAERPCACRRSSEWRRVFGFGWDAHKAKAEARRRGAGSGVVSSSHETAPSCPMGLPQMFRYHRREAAPAAASPCAMALAPSGPIPQSVRPSISSVAPRARLCPSATHAGMSSSQRPADKEVRPHCEGACSVALRAPNMRPMSPGDDQRKTPEISRKRSV